VLKPRLGQPGIAAISVELEPRTLELNPQQVREYLEEIAAPASVRARWQALPAPRRWREAYTKHAKTLIQVGTPPAQDQSWTVPVGMGFELVPGQNPTTLQKGTRLVLRLLEKDAPAEGLAISLVHEGTGKPLTATTDAEGRASFVLEQTGRWLARSTDLRASSKPGLEWESDFTTLTFTVR
jgi:uncharacterized GH25 family protein